ncbi:helix-turn-helix transcriptional regulator [Cutibacterium avidum]|uniref:helix-turn-helix transcriptional regulator n=1 Tax=Cutibacterium avidum TaxID=33010 RepID=UPI00339035B7|nr:helix-turn-helix domain-containing protein [Cutibacterium avidum]
MIQLERRFEVRVISAQQLRWWMTYRDMSVRNLASRVGVSHSTIGHLRSGARRTCAPATAKGIAKALDCPIEAIFVPTSSIVSREVAA